MTRRILIIEVTHRQERSDKSENARCGSRKGNSTTPSSDIVFYIGNTAKLLNQRYCRRTPWPHHATRVVGRPVKRHGTVTTWDDHGIQCTHAAAHCAPLDFIVGALLCHFVLSSSLFLSPSSGSSYFPRVERDRTRLRHPRLLLLSDTAFFCPVNYPCFVRVNYRPRFLKPPSNLMTWGIERLMRCKSSALRVTLWQCSLWETRAKR